MRVLAYATLVAAALGAGTVAAPAQMQAQAQAAEKPQHCVVDVSASKQRLNCYDTYTAAIAKATKGRVTDAPADVRKAMRDPKLIADLNDTSFGPNAGFVLETAWDGSDFTWSLITWSAPSGCDEFMDVDWQLAYVGDDWNDDISSYLTFSNCLAKHWEHRDFAGLSTGFDSGQSDMGLMDDEASSIEWA